MTQVEFTKNYRKYKAGDVASFKKGISEVLIKLGFAQTYKTRMMQAEQAPQAVIVNEPKITQTVEAPKKKRGRPKKQYETKVIKAG